MSAYIVNDEHINTIVSWFVEYRPSYQTWLKINGEYQYLTKDNAHKVVYELYKQNVLSVNHRYNEQTSDEQYRFEYIENARSNYSIAEIAKAIDGLEYQSCEHDTWETSEANSILEAMRKSLLSKLPDYEEAETWEITELKEVTK